MRAVVQRVSRARVKVGGEEVGAIGPGLLVLVGVHKSDSAVEAKWLAGKIANLRIFADEAGKMSLDVRELERSVLVVSQFTLHADCEKGRRPSFVDAAPPALAEPLYERLVLEFKALGVPVATGRFRADMEVELVNDGPVTLVIDTPVAAGAASPGEATWA